jgi:hypothetical protein
MDWDWTQAHFEYWHWRCYFGHGSPSREYNWVVYHGCTL